MIEIMIKGAVTLGVTVILLILPMLLPFSNSGMNLRIRQTRMSAGILLVVGAIVVLLIHRVLLGSWNVVLTAKHFFFWNFTYQSIKLLPEIIAIEALLMLVIKAFLQGRSKEPSYSNSVRRSSVLLETIVVMSILVLFFVSFSGEYKLEISEVQPNSEIIHNREEYSNYIELHNKGIFECLLTDIFLSDDPDNLRKIRVDDTKMMPDSYMLVDIDNDLMSIKKSGGQTFYLSNGSGAILGMVTTDSVDDGKSYARRDGTQEWSQMNPTPRQASAMAEPDTEGLIYSQEVEAPVLSRQAGFYDEPFELSITSLPGTTVFYTTDGSIPTTDSPEYKGEIHIYDRSPEDNVFLAEKRAVLDYNNASFDQTPVDKAFIIRAIAVNEDGIASKPVTASYFINKDQYRQYPVLSIVSDPEDLYGEDGIFVTGKEYDDWYLSGQEGEEPEPNFLGKGKGYEIPVSFEYFDTDSSFVQNVGMRIAGGSVRFGRIKRLSFFARKEYDNTDVFRQQIFEGIDSHKVVLRGNYINAIVMKLAEGRDVATQGTVRTNVFVNGEYYCQASLVEKYDEQYFAEHYGVNKSNVYIVDEWDVAYAVSDSYKEWKKLYDYIEENDLSQPETYRQFCEMVDVQSYIDYMCIRTYIDDHDFSDKKNFYMWKSKTVQGGYADGRWRWGLYDLDAMEMVNYKDYGCSSQAEKNSFKLVGEYTGGVNAYQQPLFLALYQNDEFRAQFVETFMDITNTTFNYENVVDCIEEYGTDVSEYMGHQGMNYYLDFFKERPKYIVPYMKEFFQVKGE